MKPDGRALDIVVIGLGQAGGNLAAEFFRRGYRALALNTAHTDLSALEPGGAFPTLPAERRLYVGLDGYDGAGADPSYGRECILEHADKVRSAVLKQAQDADCVILTAGLGGGTGSSIIELVNVLKDDELPLLGLMTLPTESESGIAKVNAVRAINEIVDSPLLGWIFVDNGRIASLNADVAVADYFAHINSQIAAPLDTFNRLNARQDMKAIRSFDGEDFRKLLLSGGVLNYGFSELPGISTEEVVGTVRDCVESSELMPSGFDIERLSYLGLVLEAPESALAAVPISVFEEIHEQLKRQTRGAAVYQGVYRTAGEGPTVMRLIAATQSLPSRVRQLLADAKREGQVLGEKIREELPSLELGELDGMEMFRTRTRPSERPRKNRAPTRRGADLLDDMPMEVGSRRQAAPVLAAAPLSALPASAPTPAPAPAPAAAASPAQHAQDDGLRGDPGAARGRMRGRHRRPSPPQGEDERQPTPTPAAGLQQPAGSGAPSRDIGTEQLDVSAQLAALQGPADDLEPEHETNPGIRRRGPIATAEETGELPSPEAYDSLVAQYLQANGPKVRQEVVSRLEADSNSEHTVVRYYAVEAMAKLGRKIFGSALLAATEDENDAVRQLAVQALKS